MNKNEAGRQQSQTIRKTPSLSKQTEFTQDELIEGSYQLFELGTINEKQLESILFIILMDTP